MLNTVLHKISNAVHHPHDIKFVWLFFTWWNLWDQNNEVLCGTHESWFWTISAHWLTLMFVYSLPKTSKNGTYCSEELHFERTGTRTHYHSRRVKTGQGENRRTFWIIWRILSGRKRKKSKFISTFFMIFGSLSF